MISLETQFAAKPESPRCQRQSMYLSSIDILAEGRLEGRRVVSPRSDGAMSNNTPRLVTIATCNLNQWAMDFAGNLERVKESIKEAKILGCKFRTGPELEIPGYGCEDHFLEYDTFTHSWNSFADPPSLLIQSSGHPAPPSLIGTIGFAHPFCYLFIISTKDINSTIENPI